MCECGWVEWQEVAWQGFYSPTPKLRARNTAGGGYTLALLNIPQPHNAACVCVCVWVCVCLCGVGRSIDANTALQRALGSSQDHGPFSARWPRGSPLCAPRGCCQCGPGCQCGPEFSDLRALPRLDRSPLQYRAFHLIVGLRIPHSPRAPPHSLLNPQHDHGGGERDGAAQAREVHQRCGGKACDCIICTHVRALHERALCP